jgi:hypothetical protein
MKYRELNLQVFSFKGFEKIRKSKFIKFLKEFDKFLEILITKNTIIRKNNTNLFEKIPKQDE